MVIFKKYNDKPVDSSKPSREQGDNIGQYEIIRCLGIGNVGEVYLAKRNPMNTVYAVKLLKSNIVENQPKLVSQCIQKVKFISSIKHPNLVAVMDASFDEEKHLAYIVMEYVEGCSLAKLMKSHPMTVKESFQTALATAEALQAALKHNVVHHDVNPDNILMASNGDIKLSDFGIAEFLKRDASAYTDFNNISKCASYAYMSPEQIQNESAADFRSDIYSLGATLYHAISGQKPFDGLSPEAIAADIINNPPPPLPENSRLLKPEYVKIIEWMMEKDLAKRPQSYDVLIQILNAVIECEKVRSPKTLAKLHSLMIKQHLIKRAWLDTKVVIPYLRKKLKLAIALVLVAAAALLSINYQHVIKQKISSIFKSADNVPSQPEPTSAQSSPTQSEMDADGGNTSAIPTKERQQLATVMKELEDIPDTIQYKDFLDAARNGDAAKLLETNIRLSPDSDIQDENGDSPAILAARAGSLACLRYLAEKEFDIYSGNGKHENILNLSIPMATNPDMVEFIIHSTTNTGILTALSAPDKNGNTALHLAAANTNVNFMPLFLKHLDMVSVNAKNNDGFTALEVAVKHDNIPAAQALVNQNAIVTDQALKLASPKMLELLKPNK